VSRLDREQAVSVIKEIFDACQSVEGKSIKLLPPKENGSLSHTFQVYIETKDDPLILGCAENIARKHKLAVKITDGWIIIYKPYTDK
jgi:hypothetical protein